MNPESWKKVDRIFQQALSRPPKELKSFLEEACAGDADLRREVESLIEHHWGAGSFIESPAMEVAAMELANEQGNTLNKDLSGQVISHYLIIEKIGQGGMGAVYRAEDTILGRHVAIKVLTGAFPSDSERMARFEREAKVLATLNHPNIAHIHGLENVCGIRFLVLEMVEGQNLAMRILKGPMEMEEALGVCLQIAEGLEAAHEKGVIHRDLKPANIQITGEGKVKILDFGLARMLDNQSSNADPTQSPTITAAMTRPGVVLGTAAYMSPEQAKGDPVDKRTDIWGFGCVLYECLSGKRAFMGETMTEIVASILKSEPDWSLLPAGTPAPIRSLLRRCLEKDRKRRFDSAAVVRLETEDALSSCSNSGIGEVPSAYVHPRPFISWKAWVSVAVLVIAAGSMIWEMASRRMQPQMPVRRLTVSIPASQAFVDVPGYPVLFVPDGSAIVYSGRGPQFNQLYYRRLDRLEGTALPGTGDACCPAISPSGDWVAFSSSNTIYKVSVHGGAPIELAKSKYQGGLSWGSDEVIFSAEGEDGLSRIPSNGGPSQKVAEPDKSKHESAWFMPLALPGGEKVMVFAYISPEGHKVAMVNIADGKVTEFDGGGENPIGLISGYLIFGRLDGTLGVAPFDPDRTRSIESVIPVFDMPLRRNSGVEVSVSSAGDLIYVKGTDRSRITMLDYHGQVTGGSADLRNYSWPRVSPDGRRIVIVEATENISHSDLWLYDVSSGILQRLTTGGRSGNPEWTPDGRRIVYTVFAKPELNKAWSIPADRSGPPQGFLSMSVPIVRTVISPDSRYAVVETNDSKTKHDLYLVDIKNNSKPVPLEQTSFNEQWAAISPDGLWLTYCSDESGRFEIYVRPFPSGGARVQITANGGTDPRWDKGSNAIIYRNANQFMRVFVAAGANPAVTKRETLFPFVLDANAISNYDLFPKGGIVSLRPESVDAEIVVVTNWLAELMANVKKK